MADLLADGPLDDRRLDLWWRLIGTYTGEVLVRVHGGQWVTHGQGCRVVQPVDRPTSSPQSLKPGQNHEGFRLVAGLLEGLHREDD